MLLKPWSLAAGTSEWAIRLPSVFAAMAACGLLVVVVRRLFDRRVALVSGLFLATSPFLVKWSQQARSYSFVLAAGILATLLLLRALERNSRGAWALYGLALSLVFAMQPVSAFVLVPAHLVLVAPRRRSGPPARTRRALCRRRPRGAMGFRASEADACLGLAAASFGRERGKDAARGVRRCGPRSAARRPRPRRAAPAIGERARSLPRSLGVRSVRPRVRRLVPEADLPRPVPHHGGAGLRGARGDRDLRTRFPLGVASCRSGDRGDRGRARPRLHARSRRLARRRVAGRRRHRAATARRGAAVVVVPWWAEPAATYYGASVTSTSTADSIWVSIGPSRDTTCLRPSVDPSASAITGSSSS